MSIDIVVEVGTDEQKEAIKEELLMVFEWIGEEFLKFIELSQIIIPADFDATVNRLQGTNWYTSDRIQRCVGKVIELDVGNVIIMSHITYSEFFDLGKRCKFLFHEICHLANRKNFTIPEYTHTAKSRHLNTIGIMYDEYTANRFSFKISEKLTGIASNITEEVEKEYQGHMSSIQDDEQYYLPLKITYQQWYEDGDTHRMLSQAYQFIDAAIKDVTYCYSMADSFDSIKEDFDNRKSMFLNESTVELFKLLRKWETSEEAKIDFDDGIVAMESFMATSFGITFTDDDNGERFNLVPF
jgi:hypothetical protein